jgi:hypothetical protein
MQQKFEKWQKWIEVIFKDVQTALVYQKVFWEVQDIIKENPKIQKPSTFYQFLGSGFATLGAVAVRRQIKTQKDSISLALLLKEIASDPQVLSRERYCSIHGGPFAESEFERLFGGKVGSHIEPRHCEPETQPGKPAQQGNNGQNQHIVGIHRFAL